MSLFDVATAKDKVMLGVVICRALSYTGKLHQLCPEMSAAFGFVCSGAGSNFLFYFILPFIRPLISGSLISLVNKSNVGLCQDRSWPGLTDARIATCQKSRRKESEKKQPHPRDG